MNCDKKKRKNNIIFKTIKYCFANSINIFKGLLFVLYFGLKMVKIQHKTGTHTQTQSHSCTYYIILDISASVKTFQ